MKLITEPTELQKKFLELQDDYSEYYWATAWAGVDSEAFEYLRTHEDKIKQIVVGISFHHTDPEFIDKFLENKLVKYDEQENGIFHPKLFLFLNSDSDWKLLIGSANFTNSAFTKNTEATMLVTSEDDGANKILLDTKKFINAQWDKAGYFNVDILEIYKSGKQKTKPDNDSSYIRLIKDSKKNTQTENEKNKYELFWEGLIGYNNFRINFPANRNPSKSNYLQIRVSVSGLSWRYLIRENNGEVGLYIEQRNRPEEYKEIYRELHQQKKKIETDFGDELDWVPPKEDMIHCQIRKLLSGGGYANTKNWNDIYSEMCETMNRFEKALSPHIENLRTVKKP